jgi:hypothetical protein
MAAQTAAKTVVHLAGVKAWRKAASKAVQKAAWMAA